jgi:cytochrome c553
MNFLGLLQEGRRDAAGRAGESEGSTSWETPRLLSCASSVHHIVCSHRAACGRDAVSRFAGVAPSSQGRHITVACSLHSRKATRTHANVKKGIIERRDPDHGLDPDLPRERTGDTAMKRAGRELALVGGFVAAAALWAVAPPVVAQGQPQALKQLMGENFAGLQTILISLVTANYAAVPDQVALIEEHADRLTQMIPESAKDDRGRFLSYAYNLRTNAQDLGSIVKILMEHDRGKQQLATDELREAAAAHYGGMVTMCVSCHNRFRPNPVR